MLGACLCVLRPPDGGHWVAKVSDGWNDLSSKNFQRFQGRDVWHAKVDKLYACFAQCAHLLQRLRGRYGVVCTVFGEGDATVDGAQNISVGSPNGVAVLLKNGELFSCDLWVTE